MALLRSSLEMHDMRAVWLSLLLGGPLGCDRRHPPPTVTPSRAERATPTPSRAARADEPDDDWPRHPALAATLARHRHRIVDVSPLKPRHLIVPEVALGDVDGDGRRDLYARHDDEILVWLATTLRSKEPGPSLRYRIPDEGVYLPRPVAPWWTYRNTADFMRIVDPGSGKFQELEGCTIHPIGDVDGDGQEEAWLGLDISPSVFFVPRLGQKGPPWFAPIEQADWFNPEPGFRLCEGPVFDIAAPGGREVLVVMPDFPERTEPVHSRHGRAWRLPPALDIEEAEFAGHALSRPGDIPDDADFGTLATVQDDTAILGTSWKDDGDLVVQLYAYAPGDRRGTPRERGRLPHAFEGHWNDLRRTSVDALAIEDFDADGQVDLVLVEERRTFTPLEGDAPDGIREPVSTTVEGIPRPCRETLGVEALQTAYPLHNRIVVLFGPLELEGYDEAAIDAKIDYLCPAG